MVGVDNGLFLDWSGTGRGPCGRGLRGPLGLRGFRRLGALALGTQGLELGAFLACTLLFLAAGFLGAQGLKLGALIIAQGRCLGISHENTSFSTLRKAAVACGTAHIGLQYTRNAEATLCQRDLPRTVNICSV